MTKQKPEDKQKVRSSLDFKVMSLGFKIRDIFKPRSRILEEVGIKPSFQVLDYGCGPGGYVMPVIKLIGDTGTLYALDINPLAIEAVQSLINKNKLTNVKAILSDCATGLPVNSIDVVLLYDILHDLDNRTEVIKELSRILKSGGVLSVTDHHLIEEEIIARVITGGFFTLKSKGKMTLSFIKTEKV
jgi:ubiquinone/menaquinone biosynthesis C-methylase UbiE